MTKPSVDPFAHLKQRASERADRTVQRVRTGIKTLQASGRRITAEPNKQVTRELEPGFSGLSFQVIRRNARAYALYREAADAFNAEPIGDLKRRRRRRRRNRGSGQGPGPTYDLLQRFDKRDLVHRIRTLESELETERRQRSTLGYEQQTLRAKILRLETEIILLRAERPTSD